MRSLLRLEQWILICSMIVLSAMTSAQNLVPNGGFEEGITCPSFVGNVTEECANWYGSLIGYEVDPTPDWFHTCSETDLLSPPQIAFGTQSTFEGDGYAGVVAFNRNFTDYREIIGVELSENLVIGESYLVEFRISATSTPGNAVWCNKIGFNFSTNQYYSTNSFPLNSSHFSVDTIIPESNEWIQVSEIFIPDSSYDYFHIGNFYSDINTDTLQSGISAYFLIDQVSITEPLYSTDENKIGLSLFPNPVSDVLKVKVTSGLKDSQYHVIDIVGKTVLKGNMDSSKPIVSIDVSKLSAGMYFFYLITSNTKSNEIFIKK